MDENQKIENNPEPQGGGGAFYSRQDNYRSDSRMIEMAIRKGWQIDPRLYDVLPKRAAKIALENNSARDILAAIRILLAMNSQNQADEQNDRVTEIDSMPRVIPVVIRSREEARQVLDFNELRRSIAHQVNGGELVETVRTPIEEFEEED